MTVSVHTNTLNVLMNNYYKVIPTEMKLFTSECILCGVWYRAHTQQ